MVDPKEYFEENDYRGILYGRNQPMTGEVAVGNGPMGQDNGAKSRVVRLFRRAGSSLEEKLKEKIHERRMAGQVAAQERRDLSNAMKAAYKQSYREARIAQARNLARKKARLDSQRAGGTVMGALRHFVDNPALAPTLFERSSPRPITHAGRRRARKRGKTNIHITLSGDRLASSPPREHRLLNEEMRENDRMRKRGVLDLV